MNKSQEQAARSKEAGRHTNPSSQEQGGWTDTQGGLQGGVGWLPARRELLAMREPVALKHGWVRSAPHPELPSPDFCLEKVGEAEVRMQDGNFQPF